MAAPTFVRMHHALHHLHGVVALQLQGHIAHGVHQLREEVRDVGTVLQEHVAVLAVGEVGVTQVGAVGGKAGEDQAQGAAASPVTGLGTPSRSRVTIGSGPAAAAASEQLATERDHAQETGHSGRHRPPRS